MAAGDGLRQASSLARLQASGSPRSSQLPHSVTAPCPVGVPGTRLVTCDRRGGWRGGTVRVADWEAWSRSRTFSEPTCESICARAFLPASQA